MSSLNELKLAKELIRFQSITPIDAGAINFIKKKLNALGFIWDLKSHRWEINFQK